MTGDITQDFVDYFDAPRVDLPPELINRITEYLPTGPSSLEDLPTFVQIKNIFNQRYVGVRIEILRPGVLLLSLFLLPVRENREAYKRIDDYMIPRAYWGPVEGQNSVIGFHGGRYYVMTDDGEGDVVIMTTGKDQMERELATRLSSWNSYAEVSRETFVQLFREAQTAGFV